MELQTWQKAIEELLCAMPPQARVLVLLDQAFDHGRPQAADWPDALPVYGHAPAPLQAAGPILLPLPDAPDQRAALLSRLLRHRRERPMLSFLFTTMSAVDLCAQWQGILTCKLPDDTRYLLRFADTRIQPALATHLARSAWARLSQGVHHWLLPGRDGTPHALTPWPAQDDGAKAPATTEPISLSQAEIDALLADSEADTLIDLLHDQLPDLLPLGGSPSRAQIHVWVTDSCRCAQAHGRDRIDDQIALATAVLLTQGALLADPRLANALSNAGRETGALHEALMTLLP